MSNYRVLIELPTWLGDAVMVTPAIENLLSYLEKDNENKNSQNNHKNPCIVLVGSKIALAALKHHPSISETLVLKKSYYHTYHLIRKLGIFDLAFSFRSSLRATFLLMCARTKYRYQFKKKHYQNTTHQVIKYHNFIDRSLNTSTRISSLKLYSVQTKHKKNKTVKHKKPILGINPGATYGSAKRWYPAHFSDVGLALSSRYDIKIFGSKNEFNIASEIHKILLLAGVHAENLAGKTDIDTLIYHIKNLDLFITTDSGPMHIAAAFSVPTVAIFGPTNTKETAPWQNKNSIIVKKELVCQPCMKRHCPLGHHQCMRYLEPKQVLDAVKQLKGQNLT